MASGRDGPSGSDEGPDGKRRRPQPPILDLKPTAVSVEPAPEPPAEKPSEAAAAPEPESTAAPDAATEPSDAPPAADAPAAETSAHEPPPDASLATADPPPDTAGPPPEPPPEARPEPPPAATVPPPESPDRRRIASIALAAGAGAAAGALALLLVVWLFGVPLGRDARVGEQATRIAALEARLSELAAKPPPPPDERLDGLARRAAMGELALEQARALDARLKTAEAALADIPDGAALAARVDAAEGEAKALSGALAELRGRLEAVAAVPQQPAAPEGAPPPAPVDLGPLIARLDALEAEAKALQVALEAEVARQPAPAPDGAARLAAAGVALRSAAESGAPFAPELTAVRGLAPDEARLATLEPFAETGVPDTQTLRRELRALVAEAKPAAQSSAAQPSSSAPPAGERAGIVERMQDGLARLVRVRPADAPDEPADALSPLRASVADGDLAAMLAATRALPDEQRAPFEPWIARAQGRNMALEAARDIARDGLAGLAGAEGKPAAQ